MYFPVTVKEFCVGRTKSYRELVGMETPNRFSHTVRSSHISKKIQKNPTEEVKR